MLLPALLLLQASSPHLLYHLPGKAASDRAGRAVAAAGDVDGDGSTDILVGQPGASPNGPRSGRLVVYSGKDGRVLFTIDGDDPYDQLGTAVAGAGDVNADGHDDFLVGAPAGKPAAGEVFLISGKDGTRLRSWQGVRDGDHFGEALAGPGDLNGDGVPDIAVGAPHDSNAATRAGALYTFSGSDGAQFYRRVGSAWDFLGTSVTAIGDVDGDGASEILVGAPFDDGAAFNAGAALLLSGRDGSEFARFDGSGVGDQMGQAVAAAGDINGDGVLDVLIGAPGADGSSIDVGMVRVFSTQNGAALHTIYGRKSGEGLHLCAGIGDVDADGNSDFLVGAPSATSATAEAGRVSLHSGRLGTELAVFEGIGPKDWFGASLAGLGDVDGDGTPDFVVGAPTHDDETDPGYARVLSTRPRALSTDVHSVPLSTGGVQRFVMQAPAAMGGSSYILLGSAAGTRPGLSLGAVLLPLNPEPAYYRHTLANPGSPPLLNAAGLLDANSRGTASFVVPPNTSPVLAGLLLHHAFLVLDAGHSPVYSSNATTTLLLP